MMCTPDTGPRAVDTSPPRWSDWPERYTCPRCDSREVLYHLIGMPTPELLEGHPAWVVLEGCVGPSPDFTCERCGMGWQLEPAPEEELEVADGPGPAVAPVAREVGALIVGEQSVLVGRRRAGSPVAGRWEFPGGAIDEGETPRETLARVVRETLGHEVRVGHYAADAAWTDEDGPLTVTYYWARLTRPAPPSSPRHDQLRWVPWDRLPELSPWVDVDVAAAHRAHLDLTAPPWSL